MEAIQLYPSPDQHPISPYKSHIKNHPNSKRSTNHPPFISRQTSENFAPILNMHHTTGLFQPPFPPHHQLSHSYPPFSFQIQQQPPLLPLPISTTNTTHPSRARGLSCPPTNRKTNNNTSTKARASSLTPKKSKTISKKAETLIKTLGPDPKDLPKNVPKNLTAVSVNSNSNSFVSSTNDVSSFFDMKDQVGEFSGSVAFSTISPPPSSLPLPTFSLRPKLSCKAEAAGIDAGATNNLRRLLRLP